MKQMLVSVAVIAALFAALARGHHLLGSRGLWLFFIFSAATVVLTFFLVRRWNDSTFLKRVVGICIVCLPLIPIAFPRIVMTDFDGMAYVAAKEHSAAKLNQMLAMDSRFAAINVRYDAPTNRKGQWLIVMGAVASNEDLVALRDIVDSADEWHVEWKVSMSPNTRD